MSLVSFCLNSTGQVNPGNTLRNSLRLFIKMVQNCTSYSGMSSGMNMAQSLIRPIWTFTANISHKSVFPCNLAHSLVGKKMTVYRTKCVCKLTISQEKCPLFPSCLAYEMDSSAFIHWHFFFLSFLCFIDNLTWLAKSPDSDFNVPVVWSGFTQS